MYRFTRKLLVGLATLAMASTLGVNAAQATTSGTRIRNSNSNMCVGIANGLAGQWYCTTHNDQTWHRGGSWDWNGKTYTQLINGNNQCLGLQYPDSTYRGERVVASACNGSADEYWSYAGMNSNTYVETNIVNLDSGMVMGVSGSSKANGAAIVEWTWNGNLDQYWWL
jgi:hypothetical protein